METIDIYIYIYIYISVNKPLPKCLAKLMNKLCKLINKKDFRLYRKDGLGILKNTSVPEADRKRKNSIKIFK